MRTISFKSRLVLALSSALALLPSMGVLSFQRIIQEEDEDQKWVEHTHLEWKKLGWRII
jgi:hypothetical protein